MAAPLNPTGRYGTLDRLLYYIAFRGGHAQRAMADMEELLFRRQLEELPSPAPVFVTGLPRSGTSMLLRVLYDSGRFASNTYRDMPFVMCPMIWDRFSSRFRATDQPRERAHGDGLDVSGDSPEAFEEVIWKHFWPDHYRRDRIIPWSASEQNPEFDRFMEANMRKVVALRRTPREPTPRYVSKNNANIARLSTTIPSMRGVFLVPFRDPVQQAASMLRQHVRFSRLHEEDGFMRRYMEAIGHHEFGAGLRPIDFGGWLEEAPPPDRIEFWIRYWIAAYRHVLDFAPPSVRLVDYGLLTREPRASLAAIADVLEVPAGTLTSQADRLHPPREHEVDRLDLPSEVYEEAATVHRLLELRAQSM